jgi:hypothetical protein
LVPIHGKVEWRFIEMSLESSMPTPPPFSGEVICEPEFVGGSMNPGEFPLVLCDHVKSTIDTATARAYFDPKRSAQMQPQLSLQSDDALANLRIRVQHLVRTGTAEQRQAASDLLEAIDVERERRLSPSSV